MIICVEFSGQSVDVSLCGSNHIMSFTRPNGESCVVVALKHDERPVQTVLVECDPYGNFFWTITEPSRSDLYAYHRLRAKECLMQICVGDKSLIVVHQGVVQSSGGGYKHILQVEWL